MITADDLRPGQVFSVINQGTCITPQTITVTIVWVDTDTVWYRKEYASQPRSTPLDRFLDIVNQKKKGNWYE